MGRTLQNLAKRELSNEAVFNNRFVVEACEKFHIHYRNLRLSLATSDFIQVAQGCADALARWKSRGSPENPKVHIELCRKQVAKDCLNEGVKVNLNQNLYNAYDGKIFAEGSQFKEPTYIHFKIRDMRLEMSISEFKEMANAVREADERLTSSTISSVL